MPGTEKLFATTTFNGVFYKANPADTWHNITPSLALNGYPTFSGLDFSRQTPGKVIITTTAVSYPSGWADTSSLWVTDTSGISSYSWTQIKLGLSGYTQPYRGGAVMLSMSSTDSAYIGFTTSSGTLLLNTPITSFVPTVLNTNLNNPCSLHTGGSVTQFQVSPANSKIIYATYYAWYYDPSCTYNYPATILQSTDGGHTFWVYAGCGHPDGRCLYLYSTTNTTNGINDEIFIGTDGGIRQKQAGSGIFRSITGNGLAITQFYGFGNTEANEDIMAGGAQDDGGFSYIKTNSVPWVEYDNGDAYTSKFLKNGINDAIGENNPGVAAPYPLYGLAFSGSAVTHYGIGTPSDISVSNINRPLYVDPANNAYIGYSHIWVQPHDSTDWKREFTGGDPIDFGTYIQPDIAADFYIDETNNDTVYIANKGTTTNPANDTFGLLYYSNQATNPLSPGWQNITPSICTTNNINSIAVDPNNASRIWIAFGNVNSAMVGTSPDSMTDRVWHSEDAGATWTDESAGLSALPVNKLLYRKGTNDEIYAGTDVGVYQWNPATGTWQCFNNGMPTCIVMDLEMNYCAGKLRAATYGRGIWETALPAEVILPTNATTITTNTTWSQNMWLESAVTVDSGATLTISDDTIHMPSNAAITVMPGGKLVVSGAMLTNSCAQCWWAGIQAQGNVGLPQWTAYQGWVTIKNGSTIANAQVGVSNYVPSLGWGTHGGVIQATVSTFVDNQTDAEFAAYDNFWPGGILHPNLSYFTDCNFYLDNNYKGNTMGTTYRMNSMVAMNSVEGIGFSGCNFDNTDTFANNRLIGEGIHAVNAAFTVADGCAPSALTTCLVPSVPSRFCGFTNGISIQGLWQSGLAVSIDRTNFDSCGIGVDVFGFNDVGVTRSNFIVGDGPSTDSVVSNTFTGCEQSVGILLQNSSPFRVEANNFTGRPNGISNWYNFGTVVANTGGQNNDDVYRNSFDSLTIGVAAIGNNQYGGVSGLRITCNSFSQINDDIFTAYNPIVVSSDWPLFWYQGAFLITAGNTFSSSSYNLNINAGSPVQYYFYNSGVASENPDTSSCVGFFVPISTASDYEVSVNPCTPGTFPGVNIVGTGGLDVGTLSGLKVDFYGQKTALADSQEVYNSLIDFGNTAALEYTIDTSEDTTALYALLSSGSPWISEAAFETVASYQKLPAYSMMLVLEQNPDDLRDYNFISYVQSAYSLSTAWVDTLESWSTHVSVRRTALMAAMDGQRVAASNDATQIMMALKTATDTGISVMDTTGAGICTDSNSVYYLLDSNMFYAGYDSIGVWLQNIGNLNAQYELVGYYNRLGQYSAANSQFSAIAGMLATAEDTATYNTYATIWSIVYGAEEDGRSIYQLTNMETAGLGSVAGIGLTYNSGMLTAYSLGGGVGTGGAFTGSILPIPCMPVLTEYGPRNSQSTNGNGSAQNNPGSQFSVHPNPASGVVTFTYNVPDAGGDVRIAISNIMGLQVTVLHTGNNAGNANWDTGNLPAGMYLYSASGAKGAVSMGKIVVIH